MSYVDKWPVKIETPKDMGRNRVIIVTDGKELDQMGRCQFTTWWTESHPKDDKWAAEWCEKTGANPLHRAQVSFANPQVEAERWRKAGKVAIVRDWL